MAGSGVYHMDRLLDRQFLFRSANQPKARSPTLQKIVYEISKSFDFIEITLISGDFTNFIEITLIVKFRKCLHDTSANSDIFAKWTCHVSLHECSREDV